MQDRDSYNGRLMEMYGLLSGKNNCDFEGYCYLKPF